MNAGERRMRGDHCYRKCETVMPNAPRANPERSSQTSSKAREGDSAP
jgi:hypothetical protein